MIPPGTNDDNEQLDLPLDREQPDTKALLDAVEARLALIRDYELPSVRGYRSLLSAVWASLEPGAVPVFLDENDFIGCDPRGADVIASLAAQEHALACELAALSDLRDAIRLYDRGGRMVLEGLGTSNEPSIGKASVTIWEGADGREDDRRIA